jgi:hypothetical protein
MRDRILQRLEEKKRAYAINKYGMGGMQQLKGGAMSSIPNSDAVEFIGASHEKGGIMLDPTTEVEGGETMDQVTMSKGGKRDYFFSNHLKHKGTPFAEHHKEILASGGTQNEIDYLAKMQEQKAGRTTDKIQAKLGGVMKYEGGGEKTYPLVKGQEMTERQKSFHDQQMATGKVWNGTGYEASSTSNNSNNTNTGTGSTSNSTTSQNNQGGGTPVDNTKISTQNVASDVYYDKDEYGSIAPMQGKKTYTLKSGKKVTLYGDDHLFDQIQTSGPDVWLENMYKNADPKVLEEAGITSYEELGSGDGPANYQKSWNKAYPDKAIKEDNRLGEQTTRTMHKAPEPEIPKTSEKPEIPENLDIPVPPVVTPEKKKDWSGTLLGLGSMIPAVMAFNDKPDYMKDPKLQAPGNVQAERVAKQHLERVDFNDQIARNANDATAMNKYIETSGGGPANMANKMAAYAAKQQGDREIKAQEARANIAIANEEASMDSKRKMFNSEAALDASKFNVESQETADSNNIRNNMYVDEFNRGADAATGDRRLNAVQYGINTLASLHRDKLMYQASADVTRAIDGQRGTMPRFNNGIFPFNETTTTTTTPEETTAQRGGYRQLKNLRR